jgi:hypothetical protein
MEKFSLKEIPDCIKELENLRILTIIEEESKNVQSFKINLDLSLNPSIKTLKLGF